MTWTVPEYARLIGVSRSALYSLPPERQPHSTKIGSRRLITEQPDAFLRRIGGAIEPTDTPLKGLRDEFAIAALPLVRADGGTTPAAAARAIAARAYVIADAMLAARITN